MRPQNGALPGSEALSPAQKLLFELLDQPAARPAARRSPRPQAPRDAASEDDTGDSVPADAEVHPGDEAALLVVTSRMLYTLCSQGDHPWIAPAHARSP